MCQTLYILLPDGKYSEIKTIKELREEFLIELEEIPMYEEHEKAIENSCLCGVDLPTLAETFYASWEQDDMGDYYFDVWKY